MDTKGIFKRKYGEGLQGRDWIKAIEPEDRALLIEIGMRAMEWGRLGGTARASTAKRDVRGHFSREDGTNRDTDLRAILGDAYILPRVAAILESED